MKLKLTGIGSLPHHNVDAALEHVFKYDIPYLPQLIKKSENEFMIQQALDGLTGLLPVRDFQARLNVKELLKNKERLTYFLDQVLNKKVNEFSEEEKKILRPKVESMSAYAPFLFEASEVRNVKRVKLQISGPFTSQLLLESEQDEKIIGLNDIQSLVMKWVWARSLVMISDFLERDIDVIFFFDEPGLFALNIKDVRHQLMLKELEVMLISLKKAASARIQVGIHCCSNTHWDKVLALPLDYLSLDVDLSLNHLVDNYSSALKNYLKAQGSLSLGLLPTHASVYQLPSAIEDNFYKNFNLLFDVIKDREILLSPACGLANKTPQICEKYLYGLMEAREKIYKNYSS